MMRFYVAMLTGLVLMLLAVAHMAHTMPPPKFNVVWGPVE